MKVYVPSPLRLYTHKSGVVEAEGATLAELFADLERQFPGMRFRIVNEQDCIREHIRIFVNREVASDLTFRLRSGDSVRISMALSGGNPLDESGVVACCQHFVASLLSSSS